MVRVRYYINLHVLCPSVSHILAYHHIISYRGNVRVVLSKVNPSYLDCILKLKSLVPKHLGT